MLGSRHSILITANLEPYMDGYIVNDPADLQIAFDHCSRYDEYIKIFMLPDLAAQPLIKSNFKNCNITPVRGYTNWYYIWTAPDFNKAWRL